MIDEGMFLTENEKDRRAKEDVDWFIVTYPRLWLFIACLLLPLGSAYHGFIKR